MCANDVGLLLGVPASATFSINQSQSASINIYQHQPMTMSLSIKTLPEIDSVTQTKFGNNMAPLA